MIEMHPMRRNWLMRSGLPDRYTQDRWWADFQWPEESEEQIASWAKAFSGGQLVQTGAQHSGLGLLIDGPPGAGKTTRVAALLWQLIQERTNNDRTRPFYFIRYDNLTTKLKDSWDEDADDRTLKLIDSIRGTRERRNVIELLVIDDLGKEYRTDWSERVFENLLRGRFDLGLPTIVTTNVPTTMWAQMYGQTVGSFLYEAFVHVPMLSPTGDRRLA